MQQLSELEVDVLLLFYTFSDQYGKVNMPVVKEWAQTKLGVMLYAEEITITQEHINILMDHSAIPDTRLMMGAIKNGKTAKRVKKTPPNETE